MSRVLHARPQSAERSVRVLRPLLVVLLAVALCLITLAPALAAPSPDNRVEERSAAPFKRAPVTTLEERPLWVIPVSGYRLTATFGEYGLWSSAHTGLDFAAPSGTAIVAATAGTVVEAGYDGAYGYKTVVRGAGGVEVWYCHQSSIGVSVGQKVVAGEPIGSVGTTGNVTGAHLHLEVRTDPETPVDPYAVLVDHGLRP